MSRPTDIERGARIALDSAVAAMQQPDLFPESIVPFGDWLDIVIAATDQITECDALRSAIRCGRVQ